MAEEFQPERFEEWLERTRREYGETIRRMEAEAATSGAEEPLVWGMKRGATTEDGQVVWTSAGITVGDHPQKPTHYYPDGSPILDDELMPAFMRWALLFEEREGGRIVGQAKTLYGEKLSTVWLGLDHNFSGVGPPLIYETMLFAPDTKDVRRRTLSSLAASAMGRDADPEALAEREAFDAYTAKHYPHDQLQLRYSTREEAEESFYKLRLQCLIPPRWRHFLCWTIGQDPTWRRWNEGDEE